MYVHTSKNKKSNKFSGYIKMDKQVAYLDTYYKLWYKDGLTMRDIVPKVSFFLPNKNINFQNRYIITWM